MFISVRWKLWKLWSAAITKWLCQTASIPRTEWEGHTSLMFDDRKPKFNLYNLDIASQLKNAIPRMKLGNHALTQHFTCAQTTMCCVRWWLASQLDPTLQAWAKWALLMGKRSGAAGTSRWPALETTTPTAFTVLGQQRKPEDVHKNKSAGESGSHWSQTQKQSYRADFTQVNRYEKHRASPAWKQHYEKGERKASIQYMYYDYVCKQG